MWCLGPWVSGGFGSAGLGDLRGLSQPQQFHYSVAVSWFWGELRGFCCFSMQAHGFEEKGSIGRDLFEL